MLYWLFYFFLLAIGKKSPLKIYISVGVITFILLCGIYFLVTSFIIRLRKPQGTNMSETASLYIDTDYVEEMSQEGQLFLTNKELIFIPRLGTRIIVPLKDIESVKKAENYYTKFDVITKTDNTYTFSVNDEDEWIDAINNLLYCKVI